MKAIVNIWMQPIYVRLNMESRKSFFFAVGLLFIVVQFFAAVIYFSGKKNVGVEVFLYAFLGGFVFLLVLLFCIWFLFLGYYICFQYSPANACLVPCIKRHLQWAFVIPILFCSLLVSIIFFLGEHRVVFVPALVCVALMVGFLMTIRSPFSIIFCALAIQLPSILNYFGLNDVKQAIDPSFIFSYGLMMVSLSVLILVGGIQWILSARDSALFKMHQRSLTLYQGITGGYTPENRFTLTSALPYLLWMRHKVQTVFVDKEKNSAAGLYVFCVGPRLHWLTLSTQMLLMTLFFLTLSQMMFLLNLQNKLLSLKMLQGFVSGCLLALPGMMIAVFFMTLFQTRSEQALVSLAPGVKNGEFQDRVLRVFLMRQFLILYAMCIGSMVVTILFDFLDPAMLLADACLLVSGIAVTANHAKMRAASDHPMWKIGFGIAALLGIGFVLIYFDFLQILWWYCGTIVFVTALVLTRRMRPNTIHRIFPVGRAA